MNKFIISKFNNPAIFTFIAALIILMSSSSNAVDLAKITHAPLIHGEQKYDYKSGSLNSQGDGNSLGVNLTEINIIKTGSDELNQTGALATKLKPYLQQPLSFKLMAQVRRAITEYFRSIDRPFVSVVIPPQEISNGKLRVEYTPYVIGSRSTIGNVWTTDSRILNNVHAQPNQEIDSDVLIEDLNWLNLNPYRNLEAIFEPGETTGTTNLILRSKEQKPWSVWTGYANSGSNGASPHRFYVGFDVANIPSIDHQFSYQYTASPDVYKSLRMFGLQKKDGYLSHAANYFAPIEYADGTRHKINLQAGFAQSYSKGSPFSQEYTSLQTYGEYAIPLPLVATVRSEIFGAIDYKHQISNTDFGGKTVNSKSINIMQFVAGVRGSFNTPIGFGHARSRCRECDISQGDFDLRVVASPGGLTTNNSNAAFAAMSNNPTASSRYIYAVGKINHTITLPANFKWRSKLSAQWSNKSLPDIEKFTLGGVSGVRGYQSGEFLGDKGFTFKNELVWPPVTASGEGHSLNDRLSLWAFIDTGMAYNTTNSTSAHFLSAGVGLDYRIGPKFTVSLAFSNALKDGPTTKAGTKQLFGGFKIRY